MTENPVFTLTPDDVIGLLQARHDGYATSSALADNVEALVLGMISGRDAEQYSRLRGLLENICERIRSLSTSGEVGLARTILARSGYRVEADLDGALQIVPAESGEKP